jgi:hypothetical protein
MHPRETQMLADLQVIVSKIRLATMCGWHERREMLLGHYSRTKQALIAMRLRRSWTHNAT